MDSRIYLLSCFTIYIFFSSPVGFIYGLTQFRFQNLSEIVIIYELLIGWRHLIYQLLELIFQEGSGSSNLAGYEHQFIVMIQRDLVNRSGRLDSDLS